MKTMYLGLLMALTIMIIGDVGRTAAQSPTPTPAGVTSGSITRALKRAWGCRHGLPGKRDRGPDNRNLFSPYELDWSYSYDCSEFANSQGGYFSVYIRMPDGSYSGANSPIHPSPLGDVGSGAQDYHTGGTFYFDVVSDCIWSISVTAP